MIAQPSVIVPEHHWAIPQGSTKLGVDMSLFFHRSVDGEAYGSKWPLMAAMPDGPMIKEGELTHFQPVASSPSQLTGVAPH